MDIKQRKTNNGTVYDVRYRLDGRSSSRKSVTFQKKSDAKDFLVEKEKELKNSRLGFSRVCSFEETTLSDEAKIWLEYGEVKFSKGHFNRVNHIILNDLLPLYGNWKPNRFNLEFIPSLQRRRKEINRRNPATQAKNASVNRVTETLCAILNFSAKQRRIPFNPMKGYDKLPDDSKEMSFWEPEEAVSFLNFLNGKFPTNSSDRWVYTVFLLALNTGLRAGEIWGLQPIDISSQKPTIYVKRQWSSVSKSFEMLKSKRNRKNRQDLPYRHVPRCEELRTELVRVIAEKKIKPEQTLFCGESGLPRGHDSFADRFLRLQQAWGGRVIRFHDLRHTAITLWIHKGVNIKVVKEMAGHQSLQTTMKYVHMIGGSVEEVSELSVLDFNQLQKNQSKPAEGFG